MPSLTVREIQKLTEARVVQMPAPEARVERILFDSRQAARLNESLFLAIRGPRNDGHFFLQKMYDAGCRTFLVEKGATPPNIIWPEANVLETKNSIEALQKIAAARRQKFEGKVIAITGSNGKTVVKEWLFECLKGDFSISRSPKSWNSQLGSPLSVFQIDEKNDLAIIEAGISRSGEMEKLARVIRPEIGILTHLGAAHDEGFENRQTKFREKMRLFEGAATVILPLEAALDEAVFLKKEFRKTAFLKWSKSPDDRADFSISAVEKKADGSARVEFFSKENPFERPAFSIPFSDEASIENSVSCFLAMRVLGFSNEKISARLAALAPVEQRLEIRPAVGRSILINDSWSNDLDSLGIALDFANRQKKNARKSLILSDLLQTGRAAEPLYREVAALILEQKIDRLFAVGPEIRALQDDFPTGFEAHFFETTDAFLQKIGSFDFADEVILLKGARPFSFEKIARRLEQKAHKTVLEVNLSALAHNLAAYSSRLEKGVKMCAMVKASGYGAGAIEVARQMEFLRVDYLAVAYADEGRELREAGIRLPILVLNPEEASFETMAKNQLEPEVYSLDLLEKLAAFDAVWRVHLKLDTGMRRLGFEEKDVPRLSDFLAEKKGQIEVASILSHLAASDNSAHDDFTREQAALFQKLSDKICKSLKINPLRHILNTGGIARWPQFQFEMVRLGVGLYGIGGETLGQKLRAVNSLKATISQIKTVEKGQSVGYNRMAIAAEKMRVATISIGYADGLRRAAGNGRFSVWIDGKLAPTVGSICMDMAMVDVSKIESARAGDLVEVFGENWPVERLAEACGTIPYEIFTSISERVKRVYFQE